ncbi:unnamed protein product [Heligmosomoides polygyrus]|uniref:DDE_Tnp_IS1595 domain-containing protein n=1 Tax=Heligmosomoides polygyrus TaxID=6339 RepID=A0A183FP94_HELPZ|nr:unnamed protein product [Heligmosomoides polygyrus]
MTDRATNLESLRSFSLSSSWDEFDRMTVGEFDEFLADRGLLWKSRKCPNCRYPRVLTSERGNDGQAIKMRFECYRRKCRESKHRSKIGYLKGTFFEELHGSRKMLFLASALYVDDVGTANDRARRCNVNSSTIAKWNQWFQEVIVESFFENETSCPIGGPNSVMHLEETYIANRKFKRKGKIHDSWAVVGVIEDSKEIFVEITSKRDAATLDCIIMKHVLPGTTIGNLGYIHKAEETVDSQPNSGDHSSDVRCGETENTKWSAINSIIKKRGLEGALSDDSFLVSVWKWKHRNEPKLFLLWKEISRRYPISN